MKLPESMNVECPYCHKHTKHEVALAKKGKPRPNSRGTRKFEEIKKGYGGMPRTPKKPVFKTGKRVKIMLTCSICKKKHEKVYRWRTPKAVVIGKK